MENQENTQVNEEINNPGQFQVGRTNPLHQHNDGEQDQAEEVEYTPEEMEYADGKGTELAEAFDEENEGERTENQDEQEDQQA
jgi:hypothetical protein